jgi:hypothetical protein
MLKSFARGAGAGAAGTTVLNAVTYLDMAWRGRAASSTPEEVVEKIADLTGHPVEGDEETRQNRLIGLGALSGIATGVAVGSVAGFFRPVVLRLGPVFGPLLIGGAAMAVSDVPLVKLGLTDPKTWTRTDWISDVVPHLAFGLAAYATLSATSDRHFAT